MKVIFLDFDGVITTEKSRFSLDKDAVDLLGKIIDATDAKIVISSSWRKRTLKGTIDYLKVIDHRKPFVFPYIDRIIGMTSRMFGFKHGNIERHYYIGRGNEIDRYYRDDEDIINYVIIDDECGGILIKQQDYLVCTNSEIGLTEKDVEKAIKILNK